MTGPSAFDLTGASRGLGRAIAVDLAAAGADVVLGLRSPDSATAVLDEIQALGRTASPVVFDVRDLRASRAAIDDTIARSGPIDVLVNNAGGSLPQPALAGGPAAGQRDLVDRDGDQQGRATCCCRQEGR